MKPQNSFFFFEKAHSDRDWFCLWLHSGPSLEWSCQDCFVRNCHPLEELGGTLIDGNHRIRDLELPYSDIHVYKCLPHEGQSHRDRITILMLFLASNIAENFHEKSWLRDFDIEIIKLSSQLKSWKRSIISEDVSVLTLSLVFACYSVWQSLCVKS